ncbi:MAG: VacJ family lipoprotein [Gammaproteobacteria bacterium]
MKACNRWLFTLLLAGALALGGCAGNKTRPAGGQSVVSDPFEPVNRVFFSFNQFLDRFLIRPGARAYAFMLPPVWRRGIGRAFENLDMPGTIVNDVLQLKPIHTLRDTSRFVVNTTVGLLGVVDVASKIGLHEHQEDFGQTLGRWGVPAGPYLVLPFLPPSNLRDFPFGFGGDAGIDNNTEEADLVHVLHGCDSAKEMEFDRMRAMDPEFMAHCTMRWEDEAALQALNITHGRSERLRLDKVLKLQTDQYVFVREFLMKNRLDEVRDAGDGDDDDDDDDDDELKDLLLSD